MESILTGKLYQVKTIKEWSVVLVSLDGSIQVLTQKGDLEPVYKEVHNEENRKKLRFSSSPKQLRCPTYVLADFL